MELNGVVYFAPDLCYVRVWFLLAALITDRGGSCRISVFRRTIPMTDHYQMGAPPLPGVVRDHGAMPKEAPRSRVIPIFATAAAAVGLGVLGTMVPIFWLPSVICAALCFGMILLANGWEHTAGETRCHDPEWAFDTLDNRMRHYRTWNDR